MSEKIRVSIIDEIDVQCKRRGCNCKQTVSAQFIKAGQYAATEETCAKCNHPNKEHAVLGQAKSRGEQARDSKKKN